MSSTACALMLWMCVAASVFADGLSCFADAIESHFAYDGFISNVAVQGDLVFAAGSSSEMLVLSIADPETPVQIGTVQVGGSVAALHVAGSLLFVPTSDNGVHIYDITEPATPSLVSVVDPGERFVACTVRGDLLVCISRSELVLLDIEDASFPRELGRAVFSGTGREVALMDDMALVGTHGSEVSAFDITDPGSPTFLRRTVVGGVVAELVPGDGGLLYVLTARLLRTYHVGDGALMELIDSFVFDELTPVGLAVRDHYAVVGTGGTDPARTLLFDVSDPADIRYLMGYAYEGSGGDLGMSGDRIVVASSWNGLHVIDSRKGATPVHTQLNTGGISGRMASSERTFFTARFSFVHSYDIAAPSRLEPLQSFLVGGSVKGIAEHEGLIHVAAEERGLVLIDASDPGDMFEISRLTLPSDAYGVDTEGDVACVIGRHGELFVVDVADPSNPVLVSTQTAREHYTNVVVQDSVAYVSREERLRAFDISDPGNPTIMDTLELNQSIEQIDVQGDLVATAGSFGGAQIFRFDGAFQELAVFGHGGTVVSVQLEGDRLFISDEDEGIFVVDIADPSDPRLTGRFPTLEYAAHVHAKGEMLFAVDTQIGTWVLDVSDQCGGCSADLNGDGALDVLDILGFVDALLAMDTNADRNTDGLWNFFDLVDYIEVFDAGCP